MITKEQAVKLAWEWTASWMESVTRLDLCAPDTGLSKDLSVQEEVIVRATILRIILPALKEQAK